jgi:hypothetical protein
MLVLLKTFSRFVLGTDQSMTICCFRPRVLSRNCFTNFSFLSPVNDIGTEFKLLPEGLLIRLGNLQVRCGAITSRAVLPALVTHTTTLLHITYKPAETAPITYIGARYRGPGPQS